MSAIPQPKPAAGADEQRSGSSHQINVALMKRMGSKNGYNPMPPAQHEWQGGEGQAPLHRLWSWMCAHTIQWGHRSEYATSADGDELHLDHAARDLGMHEANARMYWREGQRLGIWRNGTPKEGKRRLYLCGELMPQTVEDDPEPPDGGEKQVCTYSLPPYLLNQIKNLPAERRRAFWSAYGAHSEVRKDVTAELVAAARMVLDQDEDTLLRSFGLERERQEHARKVDPEQLRARSERIAAIQDHVVRYVRTVEAAVQTSRTSTNTVENDLVQVNSANATLLPSETARERQSGRPDSANGHSPANGSTPSHDGKKSVQLHRPPNPVAAASKSENEAVDTFLTEYSLMQLNHPKKFDGETVDPDDKGDRAATLKIVRTVGIPNMPKYLAYIEQKVVRNALGHRLRFGLVVDEWPQAFLRANAKAEADRNEHVAAEARRRANQERILQREAALDAKVEEQWTTMADVARSLRLIDAENAIKSDKEKRRQWQNMTADNKRQFVEATARGQLRREIEEKEKQREAVSSANA